MKTKIIPFDLETANKIQAGEIEGKIKTRDNKQEMRIVCYDSTARYCGDLQPIIAQDIEDCEGLYAYFEDGAYIKEDKHPRDLVLEVPDNEPQFKPFDKVLVRMNDDEYNVLHEVWIPAIFEFYTDNADYPYAANLLWWKYCIPYEGNQELVGTCNEPKCK